MLRRGALSLVAASSAGISGARAARTLVVLVASVVVACDGDEPVAPVAPLTVDAQSPVVPVVHGGFDAPLVPVRVGRQVYRLLVDTGSNYLVLFDDLVPRDDPGVRREVDRVSLRYAAATRTGHVATAEVQLGQQLSDRLRILLVDSSRRDEDPSLAPKGADGVLGLRLEPGDVSEATRGLLDSPMIALGVSRFELRLAGAGGPGTPGSLALNVSPTFDAFEERTVTLRATEEEVEAFGNCELPVTIASPTGVTLAPRNLSLDTGALTTFATDGPIRAAVGLDALAADAALSLRHGDLPLGPTIRAGDVDEKVLSSSNTYGAVVGVPWLSGFVFGFELDPAAHRATARFIDLRGGPAPFPARQEPSGAPRFTVVHDLEGADVLLDGRPLAPGERVTFAARAFSLDTTRTVRAASGAPLRRRYVQAFEPDRRFTIGECLIETSEGIIVTDHRLAQGELGDTRACDPCPDLATRTCGARSTARLAQSPL